MKLEASHLMMCVWLICVPFPPLPAVLRMKRALYRDDALLRIAEQLAQMTFAASVFGTFVGLLQDLSDS